VSELFLGLLQAILEPLVEGLLECLFAAIADLLVRSFGEVFPIREITCGKTPAEPGNGLTI
jgi:hypothetical protein